MKTKPNMPLATEGNYTEPQLGEQISGNELSPVNEQHTGDENKPKREMPEEQLVALEKYGLPRKDAKRLWIGEDRLLRNWQSMKHMLEASRPYLLQWEYEQQKAKQQGTEPRNPRGAGRKQIDMEIMFVTLMIQRFMSWSDVAIANAFAGSKLVCAVAWSLVDKGQLRFPARSTVQKYKAIFGNDGLSKQLLEVTTKTGLGLVANVLEANPAKDDDEHIEVGKVGYIDASFIDRPKFHYSAADKKAVQEGRTWDVVGAKPYTSESHVIFDRIGWAKKYNVSHFGFKVHAVVDDASKMILSYSRTAAQRHDVNLLVPLGSDAHKRFGLHTLMADSGYISAEREAILDQEGVTLCVISRNGRKTKLSADERATNRAISHSRSRVEHVFGSIKSNIGFKPLSTLDETLQSDFDFIAMVHNCSRLQVYLDGRYARPSLKKFIAS